MCDVLYGESITDSPVKLLVVTQYFWPESFRVNDLVVALNSRGHDVTVLTGLPNYPDGQVFDVYRENPEKYDSYFGIDVLRLEMAPRGTGRISLVRNYLSFAARGMLQWRSKVRDRKFDAILVYQPSPITSCLPAISIGDSQKIPVLLWTLDLWPETLKAVGVVRSQFVLNCIGVLVRYIYRNCTLVLGQSRAFIESVEYYSRSSNKFRYFPQWSENIFGQEPPGRGAEILKDSVASENMESEVPANQNIARGDAASEVPASQDIVRGNIVPEVEPWRHTFNVLFAGNIGEAQDFPAVLDAVEELKNVAGKPGSDKDIRWLIVGDGRAAEWLRGEIKRRDLTDHIILLGRHDIQRMPDFFAVADVLLVSLKSDPVFSMTIPGKVQTYLASGIPIVGMLDGEGARVINEAGAGRTVPAGDGVALAGAVRQIASLSREERRRIGENGRQYCESQFGRDELLGQLEGWIQEGIVMYREGQLK